MADVRARPTARASRDPCRRRARRETAGTRACRRRSCRSGRVQPQAREILQPQVAVAVDRRVRAATAPGPACAGVGGQQVHGRAEADLAQRRRHRARSRAAPAARSNAVEIDRRRPGLPERGRRRSLRRRSCCSRWCRSGRPRRTSRSRSSRRRACSRRAAPTGVTTPPGLRCCLHQLEVLLRVQRRGALDPGVDRVGRDDVELLRAWSARSAGRRRRRRCDPAVADDVDSSPSRRTSARRCGMSGSISQITIRRTSGCRTNEPAVTPAPTADDEHRARLGMDQRRQWPSMRCSRMSCGSLDASTLPADVEIARAVVELR